MPNIKEFYNNDSAYIGASWLSNVIYCADVSNIVFTLYEDQNCTINVRYISNNNPINIIDTSITSHIAGSTSNIDIKIKTLFIQIFIDGIASSPSILRSNGIWFLTGPQQQPQPELSYGHISLLNNFVSYTKFVTTSGREISGFFTHWVLNTGVDFSMTTDGKLKYTGTTTKKFIIAHQICTFNANVSNSSLSEIRKNGTVITYTRSWAQATTLTIGSHYTNVSYVSLSTNDFISIYLKTQTSSSSIVITGGNLIALSID
jgi:hypothetical protein